MSNFKDFMIRVKNKRDTEANWIENNPIILNGELIFVDMEDGTTKMKIGDGIHAYQQVDFLESGSSIIAITNEEIDEICGSSIVGGSEVQL